VVFLDFDGVINSMPYLLAQARSGDGEPGEASAIDPAAIRLVNRIIRRTVAVVVVSSAWRHGRTVPELRALLRSRGFRGRVVDKTPEWVKKPGTGLVVDAYGERGDEICAWIESAEARGFMVDGFVVLDDNSDMSAVRAHFVQTSMDTGITESDVERAIEILGMGRPVDWPEVA